MASFKVPVVEEEKMRICLGHCGKMRLSKHYGDRICHACKDRNKSRNGATGGRQISETSRRVGGVKMSE